MSSIQNMARIPIPKSASDKYTCLNCEVRFEAASEQRLHFKTEWHLYNLKRKVCKLEPIDIASFQQIQELAPRVKPGSMSPCHGGSSDKQVEHQLNSAERLRSGDEEQEHEDDDDLDWEEIDDEELLDEDYDEDEIEEMLGRVIGAETCLFCGEKSSSMKSNIDHMNLMHGFFVPEEQYLIDLDGLMEYLGFKVGAGLTCLWCNKQFAALHGVRLHMVHKDHCKILYDHDKAVSEFKDFYDYSNQVQIAMKPLNQLVTSKKKRTRDSTDSQIVKLGSRVSGGRQLVAKSTNVSLSETYHSKRSLKKFNAERAKGLLRIGMTNNNAMRGRLRRQNPM